MQAFQKYTPHCHHQIYHRIKWPVNSEVPITQQNFELQIKDMQVILVLKKIVLNLH